MTPRPNRITVDDRVYEQRPDETTEEFGARVADDVREVLECSRIDITVKIGEPEVRGVSVLARVLEILECSEVAIGESPSAELIKDLKALTNTVRMRGRKP